MAFKDHFSRQAAEYAAHRPTYPDELFAWLAGQAPATRLAWDVGCGSGQASLGLAAHFERVEASDPSDRQLAGAGAHPRVRYHAAAETLPALADRSVDLVTVAQALHWLDLEGFAAELRRVASPGAVVAAWTYNLTRATPSIDAVVDAFYASLDPWWPPERRHVEDGYVNLSLPGTPLAVPPFTMAATWDLARVQGYLASWSAVAACRVATGRDPLVALAPSLAEAWGDPAAARPIRWPLTVRAWRL